MISVILLNWNNAPDTLECLASLYASDDTNYSVLVADNGSTDDSLSQIHQAYPQTTLIRNGENLGFAEGNNRAIRHAMQTGAHYIFLLNNDTVIAKNSLSLLRRAAVQHPDTCLGPKIYYYDQPSTIWYGGGEWDPKTANINLTERLVEEKDSNQQMKPTEFICGCALFAPVSLIEKTGLMEPRFFLNWEEVDWSFRMRKLGFKTLYLPEAKVWHKISRSFVGGKRGPMWNYFYYRNRLFWMERHLPFSERLHIAKKVLWPEFKFLVRNSFDAKDGPVCRAALAGIRDYLLRRFGKGPSRFYR